MQWTSCIHVSVCAWRRGAVTGPWLLGWISSRQLLVLVFCTHLGRGVTEHDRGVERQYIIFLLQSSQVFQVCVSVCTTECVRAIGRSQVAKQPLCLHIGVGVGKERSTRSTERHLQAVLCLIGHVGAPDEWCWSLSCWPAVGMNSVGVSMSSPSLHRL